MAFDDLILNPAPTVRAAARRDWRWYAPLWAFPGLALLPITARPAGWLPSWATDALVFGGFLAANAIAAFPLVVGRATRGQAIALTVLPLLPVWVVGLVVRLALLAALGRLDLA